MTTIDEVIRDLFRDAEARGGVQYVYTLLRVTGPRLRQIDPLTKLGSELNELADTVSDEQIFSKYCAYAALEEPLELLANLLNCSQGQLYSVVPFSHLNQGEYPNIRWAYHAEKIRELSRLASEAGRMELAQSILAAYSARVLNGCGGGEPPHSEQLRTVCKNLQSLFAVLISTYFAERLKYRTWPKFQKLSPFMVIELLTNEEYGLYGFRLHYPAGANSEFERHPDSHQGKNFLVNPHITPWVGLIDNMQQDWLVDGKRLHELGLPGRYNPMGEWRPIVAPLAVSALSEKAHSLSDDPDVQGAIFYILSTGFLAVEFVALTNIDLPHESVSFGTTLHLWKVPPTQDNPRYNSNLRIYDGWMELETLDPEHIKHAIAMIGVALNRLAFAYDGTLNWRVKYRLTNSEYPLWTPTAEDTQLINSLLKDFPQSDDATVLDAAVDWYTRGKSSQNVFTSFLCYYVAIESVASAVADGGADFGLGYQKESKAQRREVKLACISEMHDHLYANEPERFVREAYFDCIVGLKEKTRRVAELVFGKGNRYLAFLFDKGTDGYSLTSIRGELAHGSVTLINRDHERLIRSRLHEIEEISREFLIRLIFFLKPNEQLPSWSRKFSDSMHFTDPRSTMFVNSEIPVEGKDWRIRAEWCS